MARLVKGCLIARLQQEDEEEPDKDPQQEGQIDASEGKDIADFNWDVDYEDLEPEAEPVTQVEREVDPNTEYARMEIPSGGTSCQR